MTGLSGWCSGPHGCTSPRAHATCQDRINRGLITTCNCPRGHTPKQGDPTP